MSESTLSALVVDDEVQMRRLLRITLEAAGYRVLEAASGQEALAEAAMKRPDIVLLDLGLPDLDGLSVLRRLREWSTAPVVVLTVRDGEDDKIAALDGGADDYVCKPFAAGELLARLRAALRRRQPAADEAVLLIGAVELDLPARQVRRDGREVKLTATEYALFKLLAQHAGRVITHRQLLREVWGPAYEAQTHYLRVYVGHLREKLEDDPSRPQLLLTEPGIGYRLVAR